MTGAEIIERAKQAQEKRKGIRVKVRVPSSIWHRVKMAADAAGISNEEWVCSVCRSAMNGKLDVPSILKKQMGTFSETETVWIRTPEGFDTSAHNLRCVLTTGCNNAELYVDLAAFKLVEGRDYLIAGKNYSGITPEGVLI